MTILKRNQIHLRTSHHTATTYTLLARTVEVPVFQAQTDSNENEVQHEHGEAEALVHLPPEAGDAEDDEQQHGEEQDYAADHTLGVDLDGRAVDQPV